MAEIEFDIGYDTSKMMFDPMAPGFYARFSEAVPSIKSYKVRHGLRRSSVACYIALMYDRESPLLQAEPLYWKRKVAAAELARFPKGEKGAFNHDATRILTGEDKAFIKVALDFIDLFALPEFSYLIGLQVIQSDYMFRIMRGDISSDSDKVLGRVAAAIKEVTRQIFKSGTDDEITAARKAVYEKAIRERSRLRPEDLAEVLAKTRELPKEFGPYDDGEYEPDKLKFLGDDEETALRKLSLDDEEE